MAKEVHERLVAAASYTYTADDVDRIIKEKKAKGTAPRNAGAGRARERAGGVPAAPRRPVLLRRLCRNSSVPPLPLAPAALERARLENQLSHAREHGDAGAVAE